MRSFEQVRAERLAAEVGTIHKQATLRDRALLPEPVHGRDVVARLPDRLPAAERPARRQRRAGVPARRRRARPARRASRCARTNRRGRSATSRWSRSRSPTSWRSPAWSTAWTWPGSPRSPRSAPAAPASADPLVVVGGPLTFSNPVPAAPFADVMLLGEARRRCPQLIDALRDEPDRAGAAGRPGRRCPASTCRRSTARGCRRSPRANDHNLPAYSQIRTPHTELRDMFLIEPERGCYRGCTYCVMRRSTNGGMRLVAPAKVKSLIPDDARRVGLVGAAVTDHPGLPEILRAHRRRRPRGRHLQPARRPAERRDRRPAQARRLPHADHRGRRRLRADARATSSARPRSAT